MEVRKCHIGKNIKIIREYMGVKQQAIAIELGVNQNTISKLEQQETVNEEILIKIARAIGVSPQVIKYFDLEKTFYNINSSKGETDVIDSTPVGNQFNPVEKIVELYERLLKCEKARIETLTKIDNL